MPDGLERENAIVLEQDHGLVGDFAGHGAMLGAVEQALVDLGVGHHLRRVEHAELHARGEEAGEGDVDVAFLEEALLDGVEIGLVVVIVLDLGGEVDALVVHAALEADGRGLGLRGLELVAGRRCR